MKTSKSYKYFLVALSAVALLLVATSVLAAPPTTRYAPGETLNPTCSPTDANCGVDQIYVNPTTLQYGIGTSTPYSKLTLWGAGTGTGKTFEIANSASTTLFSLLDSGLAYFLGNVGIGTTSPAYKLDVSGFLNTDQYSGYKQDGNTVLYASTTNQTLAVGASGAAAWMSATSSPYYSTAVGYHALNTTPNSTGLALYNSAFGVESLLSNTQGASSTALGYRSLFANTTGTDNTGTGFRSLSSNTTGSSNTANGGNALYSNTKGSNNTATGLSALFSNSSVTTGCVPPHPGCFQTFSGSSNTANGSGALYSNAVGSNNTANGANALYSNIGQTFLNVDFTDVNGSNNTANGANALQANTSGSFNTANGSYALYSSVTGNRNVGVGYEALYWNTSATSSTALGYFAGQGANPYSNQGGTYIGYQSGVSADTGSDYNTFLGYQSGYGVTTGSNNIWIGTATSSTAIANLTTGSQNILIGNNISLPSATASGQLNIGNIIFGTGITSTGSTVSTGKIGIGTTTPSNILHVAGTPAAGTGVAQISNTLGGTTQNNGLLILAGNNTGVAASQLVTFQRPDATVIGSISQNAAATVAYNTSSDRRIKENIASTTFGLSDLLKINVDDFTFLSDPSKQKTTGFIAQELKNIFPNAVTTNGDNGTDLLAATSTPWMVDYSKVTPLLVKGAQDLDANLEGIAGLATPAPGSPGETFTASFFKNIFARVGMWLADAGNSITDIFARTFHAKDKLCINNTCVTEDQLKMLLQHSGISPSAPTLTATSTTTITTSTPLTISIQGNNPATIKVGDRYGDLGATITAPTSALNLGIKASVDGGSLIDMSNISIDTKTAGVHHIVYTVVDQTSATTTAERILNVVSLAPPAPTPIATSTATTTLVVATSTAL